MVEFGTSSTFRGWVRVRVLGYGSGVRDRKVKSRDCALASDLVRAPIFTLEIGARLLPRGALRGMAGQTTSSKIVVYYLL